MKYTHEIQWMGQKLKCFVYKDVKEQNGKVYIRTEDNRSCWWEKSKLSLFDVSGMVCVCKSSLQTYIDTKGEQRCLNCCKYT